MRPSLSDLRNYQGSLRTRELNGVGRIAGQAEHQIGGESARFSIAIDVESEPKRRRRGPAGVRDLGPDLVGLEKWWT